MNSRLKELRKTLNLTQKEFGARIGLKTSSYSDIENGRLLPTERNISLICSAFNVNEEWLRTGKGDMFTPSTFDDELMAYCADICKGDDEFIKNYIVSYMKLTDEQKAFMRKLVRNFADTNETKK